MWEEHGALVVPLPKPARNMAGHGLPVAGIGKAVRGRLFVSGNIGGITLQLLLRVLAPSHGPRQKGVAR